MQQFQLSSCRAMTSFMLGNKRKPPFRQRSQKDDGDSTGMVIDNEASPSGKLMERGRLPTLPTNWEEFPAIHKAPSNRALATGRILFMALRRVVEPPTLHLLAAAGCAALGVGALEATLMCQHWPTESLQASQFVVLYSLHNLFPSVVWETQDASLVCTAWGLDPKLFLRDLSGTTSESAWLLLQTHWLSTSRFFFAGFMMIAQLFRAATISMESFEEYEERIKNGREPPLVVKNGLVVRFCGRDSHVSEVSLQRMGAHVFPVFEHPERVRILVKKHSEKYQRPVYWCVPPGRYWRKYSWEKFPTESGCFLKGRNSTSDKILFLEADATNGNDPLTIGETALDLTIEDASQGFRRILDRYREQGLVPGRDFRPIRVYLGNSMETTTTGGGHAYTLRHRVRYAKEMDILIDSRAPVLRKILDWCESVASKDRKIFFQTTSREYFLNLQTLLKEYGYDIYDPLDLRVLPKLRESMRGDESKNTSVEWSQSAISKSMPPQSFLSVLLEDPKFVEQEFAVDKQREVLRTENAFKAPENLVRTEGTTKEGSAKSDTTKSEMLRMVTRLARLPRLVHMETTAETVNAVEALIAAGEVDASSCCALLDRQEGVAVLESSLQHRPGFVQFKRYQWQRKLDTSDSTTNDAGKSADDSSVDDSKNSGLQIICSSTIHDDVLRQVRWWARQGYQASAIQKEIDAQYQELLQKSHIVQKQVIDTTKKERADEKEAKKVKDDAVNEPVESEKD